MDGVRRRGKHRVLRLERIEARLMLAADWTGLSQVQSEFGLSGKGQTVAVIDTGVDYLSPALGGGLGPNFRVVGGYDFADNSPDPEDNSATPGHGTHVAGVLAGSDPACPGVAPDVDLVALRVFNSAGQSSLAWVDEALQWVNIHRNDFAYPITTVNLSLGAVGNFLTTPSWGFLEKDLAQSASDGIFVSVAAGNGFMTYNAPGVDYPAVSQYVVPVAAGTADGQLAGFSQRDSHCLVAPGVRLVNIMPGSADNTSGQPENTAPLSGTSEAAAYLAGAAVLLRQAYQEAGDSNVSLSTLEQTLYSTADTIYDSVTGQDYDRLNLAQARSIASWRSRFPPASADRRLRRPAPPPPVRCRLARRPLRRPSTGARSAKGNTAPTRSTRRDHGSRSRRPTAAP